MVWVGRNPKDCLVPTHSAMAIQPDLENFQAQSIHNISVQLVLVPHSPHGEEIFRERWNCNKCLLIESVSGNVLKNGSGKVICNMDLWVQAGAIKSLLPARPSLLTYMATGMWCSSMLLLDAVILLSAQLQLTKQCYTVHMDSFYMLTPMSFFLYIR